MKNTLNQNEINKESFSFVENNNFTQIDKSQYIVSSNYINNKRVDLLTRYYLYYYISLEKFILETSLDQTYFMNKLKTIGIKFKPQEVFISIDNLLRKSLNKEEFEKSLREDALLFALGEFINNDKDLLSSKYYVIHKKEQIKNDSFFDNMMYIFFEKEYLNVYKYFNKLMPKLLK